MNKTILILLFLFLTALADEQNPTIIVDEDNDGLDKNEEYVPIWKINAVLRENDSICYDYLEGCNYSCAEDCLDYTGDNSDSNLAGYKYCCPKNN